MPKNVSRLLHSFVLKSDWYQKIREVNGIYKKMGSDWYNKRGYMKFVTTETPLK